MAAQGMTGRTLVGIAIALGLTLAVVNIWWLQREEVPSGGHDDRDVSVRGAAGLDRPGVSVTPALSPGEQEDARKADMGQLLRDLAAGTTEQRRFAAMLLRYQADESAEPALLKALHDPDLKVAHRSSKALISLWQHSDSPAINRVFNQGLTAFEAGNYREALEVLDSFGAMEGAIPDLYRLRAEARLALAGTGRPESESVRLDVTLDDCRMAIAAKDVNFMAHYTQARCYVLNKDGEAALESIDRALDIYPGFQQGYQLKMVIRSMQEAGEL